MRGTLFGWSLLALILDTAVSQSTSGAPTSTLATNTSSPSTLPSPSPTGIPVSAAVASAPAPPVAGQPSPRYGASAQLIHDQSLIVFFGGYVGTPQQGYYVDVSAPFELQPTNAIVTLSLNQGFEFNTGNWQTIVDTSLSVPAKTLDSDPRVTAYGSSVVVRSVDVGDSGNNVDTFYYVFGQNNNVLLGSDVYKYNQGDSLIHVFGNQSLAPPSRNRAASCLIDPTTTIIHGGLSGVDNSASAETIQSTWILSLKNISSSASAWQDIAGSSTDPTLHDHMGACLLGNMFMVGGVTDQLDSFGNLVMATMDHVWVFSYNQTVSDGSWTAVPLSGPKGFPSPRRSATLTAADPAGSILYLHGGTASDYSETYSDLWQLDIKSFSWTPLASSKYTRHSHNAIYVNGMLITAFGVMSDANSTLLPPAFTPPLWVYNSQSNTWGGFPASAILLPNSPPPLPAHSPAISLNNVGGQSSSGQVSPVVIFGLVGAAAAFILGVVLFVLFDKHHEAKREKDLQEDQEMQEQLREQVEEDMGEERSNAFAQVIGVSKVYRESAAFRMVGGKLARVIEGTADSTADGYFEDDIEEEEEVEEFEIVEDDSDSNGGSVMSTGVKSHHVVEAVEQADSEVSGVSQAAEESMSADVSSVGGSSLAYSRSRSAPSKNGDGTPSLRPVSVNIRNSLLIRPNDVLNQAKRASRMFVGPVKAEKPLEPMRPWEGPGMGVQKAGRPMSRLYSSSNDSLPNMSRSSTNMSNKRYSSAIPPEMARTQSFPANNPNRESRINLAGLIGELPDVDDVIDNHSELSDSGVSGSRTNNALLANYLNQKRMSSFSSASDNSSAMTGSDLNPQQFASSPGFFDPMNSMKLMFAKFSSQQILDSWNAYSASTGVTYSMEQVEAMRAMHAPETVGMESPPISPVSPMSPGGVPLSRRKSDHRSPLAYL
ncbi:hypothetical protein HDU98_004010 [Podochytrium sp. JEL0797]|nr:hypothetical protein HDU98_004010 [Podochytrium sp. JEL0797]